MSSNRSFENPLFDATLFAESSSSSSTASAPGEKETSEHRESDVGKGLVARTIQINESRHHEVAEFVPDSDSAIEGENKTATKVITFSSNSHHSETLHKKFNSNSENKEEDMEGECNYVMRRLDFTNSTYDPDGFTTPKDCSRGPNRRPRLTCIALYVIVVILLLFTFAFAMIGFIHAIDYKNNRLLVNASSALTDAATVDSDAITTQRETASSTIDGGSLFKAENSNLTPERFAIISNDYSESDEDKDAQDGDAIDDEDSYDEDSYDEYEDDEEKGDRIYDFKPQASSFAESTVSKGLSRGSRRRLEDSFSIATARSAASPTGCCNFRGWLVCPCNGKSLGAADESPLFSRLLDALFEKESGTRCCRRQSDWVCDAGECGCCGDVSCQCIWHHDIRAGPSVEESQALLSLSAPTIEHSEDTISKNWPEKFSLNPSLDSGDRKISARLNAEDFERVVNDLALIFSCIFEFCKNPSKPENAVIRYEAETLVRILDDHLRTLKEHSDDVAKTLEDMEDLFEWARVCLKDIVNSVCGNCIRDYEERIHPKYYEGKPSLFDRLRNDRASRQGDDVSRVASSLVRVKDEVGIDAMAPRLERRNGNDVYRVLVELEETIAKIFEFCRNPFDPNKFLLRAESDALVKTLDRQLRWLKQYSKSLKDQLDSMKDLFSWARQCLRFMAKGECRECKRVYREKIKPKYFEDKRDGFENLVEWDEQP